MRISRLAISMLATVWLIACGDASERSTTPDAGTHCGGTRISLTSAREAAAFDLVEPRAPLADSSDLQSVWRCSTVAGGFLLVYDSGVGVLESVDTLRDPAAEWQGLADAYEEFSVGEINGIPASFADPAIDDAIGGVDFVASGVRYTVSGDGAIPLDDLIAVARSLRIGITT